VVTEYLIRYCELIFSDKMPVYQTVAANCHLTNTSASAAAVEDASPSKRQQLRPKSLAISTPTKLLSLEEARNRALQSSALAAANVGGVTADQPQRYIDVGGGPATLPAKYHTVIELSRSGGRSRRPRSDQDSAGWRAIFGGGRSRSKSRSGKADSDQVR